MPRNLLHLDIGSAVTSARAIALTGDTFSTSGYAFCPSPPPAGGDLTSAVEPAIEAMKRKMGVNGASYDPESILVTVSAGGEPRTVCAGVVKGISGESAKRAALSAGATVADLIAVDDGRQDFERISDLRRHEIAMVVMAGGVDEEILKSGKHQILNIAKVIADGLPRRRGSETKVPLVYAASAEGRSEVARIMQDTANIVWADNVRPTLEVETLDSARSAVVHTFMEGVRRDPRFRALGRLGSPEANPGGYAVSSAVEEYYRRTGENLLVISLDGDSVQVVSAIGGVFTRTVTPVHGVEPKGMRRYLPWAGLVPSGEDLLGNWKIRPRVLPRTWDELAIFLAIYKEAVRLAMVDHSHSAIELRGIHRQRLISETFQVRVQGGDTLVRMERIGKIVFTGYLSRLLSPASLMSLAADAADPSGITEVYLDEDDSLLIAGSASRLGMALRVEDRLRPLGVLVSAGKNEERVSPKRAAIHRDESREILPVVPEEVSVLEIRGETRFAISMEPQNNKVDFGEGEGRKVRRDIAAGFGAVYLDGRARRPRGETTAQEQRKWYRGMKVFPDEVISGWAGGRE
ncbi:MAG: glutamate mutase L [Bacillota bacterium]